MGRLTKLLRHLRQARAKRWNKNAQAFNGQMEPKGRRAVGGYARRAKLHLEIKDIHPSQIQCERVLTCGMGKQLGHPGQESITEPRTVNTLDENLKFVQASGGGVHSLLLTSEGRLFSCGANEKGAVPVQDLELEDAIDVFKEIELPVEIRERGKIVQIATGEFFGAGLISDGSVVAWGNLQDSSGDLTGHSHLSETRKTPTIIHLPDLYRIVKIAAGENHLAMLAHSGQILTFGDGSFGQLGRSTRSNLFYRNCMADETGKRLVYRVMEGRKEVKFTAIFAGVFWTIGRAEDGRLFACGLNHCAHLGVLVPTEQNGEANGQTSAQNGNRDGRIRKFTHARALDSGSKWTHIAGGQHLALRNENGEVYTLGNNLGNILGLGTWTGIEDNDHSRYETPQKVPFPDGVKIAGIHASFNCTMAWTEEGDAYSFGYNHSGQLGLGSVEDEDGKTVATPRKIECAHLNDYAIRSVSLGHRHAIFMATKRS